MMLNIIIQYNNYYIDKKNYNVIFNIINDENILQSIDKLTTYEFITYKTIVLYKLEKIIIDKLISLNYQINYINNFEQYKLELNNSQNQKNKYNYYNQYN